MFNNIWVIKWDGSENTAIEAVKGGLSSATKRAGSQWGIGRYLYKMKTVFGICILEDEYRQLKHHEKQEYTYAKDKKTSTVFYWKAPKIEERFLPQKYIAFSTLLIIRKLIKDTLTEMPLLLENYGVSDLRDLFTEEAGEVVTLLLQRQTRIKDEMNENTQKN